MNHNFNGLVIEDRHTATQPLHLQNLQVTGDCYFMETVEADRIDITGTAQFREFATCDRLWISGEACFKQNLLAETIQVPGDLTVLGRCWSDVAVFEHKGNIQGAFSAGRLLVKGSGTLEATQKLKGDRVTIQGQLLANEQVNCQELEILSCFPSRIHELNSDRVTVRYVTPPGQLEMTCTSPLLTVTFMDVSEANLTYTHVEELFCDSAVIGKGCYIRELIYRKGIEIDSGAVVERLLKA
ncbi:MAG: hypothetical protein IKU26_08270 [Clostridia bacterium]|nr:hypothetical protein [Clostridia bacterium]